MRIYALDFDGTTTCIHTHHNPQFHYSAIAHEKGMNTPAYKKAILDNIRNPEKLKEVILKRSAAGDLFTVATAHPDETHVRAYFDVLLDGESTKYVPVIHCQPYIQPQGKNHSLQDIFTKLQKLGKIDRNLTLHDFGHLNITLIDDTKVMVEYAKNGGFSAIHVDANNDSYFDELAKLITADEKFKQKHL